MNHSSHPEPPPAEHPSDPRAARTRRRWTATVGRGFWILWACIVVVIVGLVVAVVVNSLVGAHPLGASGPAPEDSGPEPVTPPPTEQPTGAAPGDSGPEPVTPPPTEQPTGAAPDTAAFREFLDACALSLDTWHPGQARYPTALTIPLEGATTYQARVDIDSGVQAPPGPGQDTAVVPLLVRCGIGARLVSLGDSISVENEDWSLAEFDQPGFVQWSWTVKATAPDDAQVRLELRPAVVTADGHHVVPAGDPTRAATSTFTTDVQVEASWPQHVDIWWTDNWDTVTTIAAGLGAAVLTLITWLKKAGSALGLARRWPSARRRRSAARTGGSPASAHAPKEPHRLMAVAELEALLAEAEESAPRRSGARA